MNDKLKMFEQKHGQELKLDLNNKKTKECLNKISKLNEMTTMYLTLMAFSYDRGFITVPCITCLKNTALEFEEIGSLLRELCDDK